MATSKITISAWVGNVGNILPNKPALPFDLLQIGTNANGPILSVVNNTFQYLLTAVAGNGNFLGSLSDTSVGTYIEVNATLAVDVMGEIVDTLEGSPISDALLTETADPIGKVTVSPVLSLAKMPTSQQGLATYAEGVATQTNNAGVISALEIYKQDLQRSTSPSTRSAVNLVITTLSGGALKAAIRNAVQVVKAADKKFKAVILAKEAPSFTLKAGPGTLKFSNLKGKPKNVETWFQIQVVDNIDDDDGKGFEEEITRTGAVIDSSSMGGETVYVRGRWVWRVNGVTFFGPWTATTRITLPDNPNNDE